MKSASDLPSIRDLPPLESGGYIARRGFAYQDHVAVAFALDLIENPQLVEVWCETHDDIILIWQSRDQEEAEFVQVKGSEFDQLWSIALLCRPDGASGRSLIEKSLAHDRCQETCAFRIVTRWQVKAELEFLTRSLQQRKTNQQGKEVLIRALTERAPEVKSKKGNGVAYWVERTIWEVRGEQQAVIDSNLLRLSSIAYNRGVLLAPDQLQEVYERLLQVARNAAEASPAILAAKRLLKGQFIAKLAATLETRGLGSARHQGLDDKLSDAGFAATTIASAGELRRRYRREVLAPKYFTSEGREELEEEVQGVLHRLKADLDAGVVADTPQQFLVRCLTALNDIRGKWGVRGPSEAMLQGMMYDLTNRCLHRFHRTVA